LPRLLRQIIGQQVASNRDPRFLGRARDVFERRKASYLSIQHKTAQRFDARNLVYDEEA